MKKSEVKNFIKEWVLLDNEKLIDIDLFEKNDFFCHVLTENHIIFKIHGHVNKDKTITTKVVGCL